jgi:beta-lactamase regulating signal transducer with metallopeptidase domain
MSAIHLQQAMGWCAERLLNGVPDGIVVAVLTWFCLRMFGRKNASTRFAVWALALLSLVVLPLASGLMAGHAESGRSAWSAIVIPGAWARGLFFAWAAMAVVGLSRIALGLWNLRTLRGDHVALDPRSLDPRLERTLNEFQHARKVTLAQSRRVSVPVAIGFLKPMILLPAWALSELSPEELNSILIHELAHLGRWDDWSNLGQKIIRAVLFFHPAVWWIDHQLSFEREMACDDHVLSRLNNPRSYAECLVAVAEKSLLHRGLGLAQAAVRGMRQTSRRVVEILAANRPQTPRVWKPAVGMVAAFAALAVVWFSRAPELVAVRDPVGTVADSPALGRTALPALRSGERNLVLAKLELDDNPKPPAPLSVLPHATRKPADGTQARPVPRKFDARLVPATWVANRAPIETLMVVMRASPDGGSRSWIVCVWRISTATRPPVEPKVLAHSI